MNNGLRLEVVTLNGRAAALDVRVQPALVEIWHHSQRAAVFHRDQLRAWLKHPDQPLAAGTAILSLSLDRIIDQNGRIAITLPDVIVWALSPTEIHTLQRIV